MAKEAGRAAIVMFARSTLVNADVILMLLDILERFFIDIRQ